MDQHLDTEQLAAFADGSLTRAERAAVETHAADCVRCLQLLAAMARTEPPQPSRWRSAMVLRWAVPVAAAATALALWVNADRTERDLVAPPQATIAPAPRDQPASSARESDSAAPAPPAEPAPAAPVATDALSKSVQAPSGEARGADVQQRKVGAQANEQKLARKDEAAREREEPRTFADTSQPPVAGAEGAPAARLAAAAPAIEVVSPDPSIRWRMRGIHLERSTDTGRTWTSDAATLHGTWLAGASPAPSVAWFVGRGGDVLIDADGNVVRRRLTEPVDLLSVAPVSGSEAAVTTADGRVFATTDGGVTWTRR